ncbi:MAG TPA: calcium/sodium antiporter [Candidatus Paceibacterota bacterium]|nr:calcium/sodium antiporter [Candidatus Paceibacterota bacterium]
MLTYIFFFLGFYALIKGADLLVDGASSLANRLGVSALVIGLTVVAFGTSAPELAVNILASLNNSTDIAVGNILGSNIANILLILGVSAVIYPLAVQQGTVWKEIPFALLAVMVLGYFVTDGEVGRSDGFVLIIFFALFVFYIYRLTQQEQSANTALTVNEAEVRNSLMKSWLMVIVGMVGLVVGGKWIVDGAVAFAAGFGVSEALIGLTIVAIGTSLPEMATSAVAAYKKNVDIAVGNIVGSNIFNIFWILGISSIIQPLPFSSNLTADLKITFVVTLALFLALFVGKKHLLERWQGIAFVLLYVFYTGYLILRG